LVGTPPLLRAASFYAALSSTTAVATAITATAVVVSTTLETEVTVAHPQTRPGARTAVLWWSVGGCTGRIPYLSIHPSSGKRGSSHHSLRQRIACFLVLRKGVPERSTWLTLRDDLNDSSYQLVVFSVDSRSVPELDPGFADRRPRQRSSEPHDARAESYGALLTRRMRIAPCRAPLCHRSLQCAENSLTLGSPYDDLDLGRLLVFEPEHVAVAVLLRAATLLVEVLPTHVHPEKPLAENF
jgi:hypothetical protein